MILDRTQKVKSVPVQVISVEAGIILLRGCEATKIAGTGVAETVQYLLSVAANGITCAEFIQMFPVETQPFAERLFKHLIGRRILVPFSGGELSNGVEAPLDVFYWHFGRTAREVSAELNVRKFILIGRNEISLNIAKSFERAGVYAMDIIDDLEGGDDSVAVDQSRIATSVLGKMDPTTVHCVIATSVRGALSGIRKWNKYCVARGLNLMPVVLQAHGIYIGPLIVPGDTACFHCVELRRNSVEQNDPDQAIIDEVSLNGQDVVSFHPSMPSIAAEFTVIELMKAYGPMKALSNVGTILELDLLTNSLNARKVVKLPRCPTCTPLKTQVSINIRGNPIARRQ